MILLIDNYDSFSYNLYQLVGAIDPDIRVIRNDELRIEEIDALHPARIILSPGPGRPEDAGVLIDVVKTLSPRIPTLGVCLGHQAICAAFGATVTYAKELMHGKQSLVHFDTSSRLFKTAPRPRRRALPFPRGRRRHHAGLPESHRRHRRRRDHGRAAHRLSHLRGAVSSRIHYDAERQNLLENFLKEN